MMGNFNSGLWAICEHTNGKRQKGKDQGEEGPEKARHC